MKFDQFNQWMERLGFTGLFGSKDVVDDQTDIVRATAERMEQEKQREKKKLIDSSNDIVRALVGSLGYVGEFYFPPGLMGGTCPRVSGQEEEIVWNAAAEACDSERVHVVWQARDNRIWYLAVRSEELASQPNSWCPFGSFLPTMRDAQEPPVCYTYFGEEAAVLMVVTHDSLQIFRGTTPVVRAKAERTARELGQAPIVSVDPDRIEQLSPSPWFSMSLFEDRARRTLATLSVLAALTVLGLSFFVWMLSNMTMLSARHDLAQSIENTRMKSLQLMNMAERARSSDMRKQLDEFLRVNDGLLDLNGYLSIYEIAKGKTRWRATVPPSATADRISEIKGKTISTDDKGVAIGNQAQVDYEQTSRDAR